MVTLQRCTAWNMNLSPQHLCSEANGYLSPRDLEAHSRSPENKHRRYHVERVGAAAVAHHISG